jgi:hypothetical protein
VSGLRYRTSPSILNTSISYAYSISTFCTFDVVFRYRKCSISKVSLFHIEGDKPSILKVINRVIDIEVLCLRHRTIILRHRTMISYTKSKVTLTFDIEGHVIHIGFEIVYDIALSQCHSLRSGSSLCAGSITRATKSLSTTCPGFLHPLFAQFYSLLRRYLSII